MGVVQHRQISTKILSSYADHIDISDITSKLDSDIQNARLTRGLAAYTLSYVAGLDPATSCQKVTDGFNDNGIDAIHFDTTEKVLYFLQSKWNNKYTQSIDVGDTLKFIKGMKDLLNSRYQRFGAKIGSRRKEIDAAIGNARKVVAIICYSGSGAFSSECREAMDSFIDEVDETKEMVSYQIIQQSQLHEFLLQGAAGAAPSCQITLYEYGYLEEPVRAYYGQISATDLVELHKKFGHRLFAKNVRVFLGDSTEVNVGIQNTLAEHANLFWYMNNGITALASDIRRVLAGAGQRSVGRFDCSGLTVVNGAQTIGSLSVAAAKLPEGTAAARVPFRIISLDGAPDGFAALITRTNNTQNRMDARNFVALDPEQERLKAEFAIDQIQYEYRQGDIEVSSNSRLGLVEATVALACTQNNVDLAVQAKREIGKLWEDITKAPYKILFNSGRTSEEIWKRVAAFRRISNYIILAETVSAGKISNIATHGNRFLAHICYKHLVALGKNADLSSVTDDSIHAVVSEAVNTLSEIIDEDYADNYVASLFKNLGKCRDLAQKFESKLANNSSKRAVAKEGPNKSRKSGSLQPSQRNQVKQNNKTKRTASGNKLPEMPTRKNHKNRIKNPTKRPRQ